MAGLVDADCRSQCSFSRTVTDQKGGGSWTAAATDFPEDVVVEVSPESFTVGNGQSRSLEVDVNLTGSEIVGEWISGRIKLSSTGSPDQFLTVSVFSDGGEIPQEITVSSDLGGGWQ